MSHHSERSEESSIFRNLEILRYAQDDKLPELIENLHSRQIRLNNQTQAIVFGIDCDYHACVL